MQADKGQDLRFTNYLRNLQHCFFFVVTDLTGFDYGTERAVTACSEHMQSIRALWGSKSRDQTAVFSFPWTGMSDIV